MSITLSKVPGFTDITDSPLTTDKVALGVHVAGINDNAAFGLVRTEFFQGIYENGDTIPRPVSAVDGYTYTRDELMYVWGVYSTANVSTNWLSGPDALWYMNWNVNQDTGEVTSIEWYVPWHGTPAQSNDGQLLVTIIGVRQLGTLDMASEPSFSDLPDGTFYQDAPWKQVTARGMNDNAKYGVTSTEVISMGEFWSGKTVPQPVSDVDGHTYPYANVKFIYSWVWTTPAASFTQPTYGEGQFAGMYAAIDATTGAVSLEVHYIAGGGEGAHTVHTDHGRIRVWALCDRNEENSITLSAVANDFAEVTQGHFYPGEVMQASVMSRSNKNAREAIVTPEFFGPTEYFHNDTVPVPTSAVDGHVYTRQELFYQWEWKSSTTAPDPNHNRMALFDAKINPSNGVVTIDLWRLAPGGPYRHEHGTLGVGSIMLTVIACRTASNDTTDTHVVMPFPTLSMAAMGHTGGADQNTTPAGTAVKIVGNQWFGDAVSASCRVTLQSSDETIFNGGVLNIRSVIINRTLAGSTAVIDSQTLTFSGDSHVDIAHSSSIGTDDFNMILSADYDYYILCSHFGTEAETAYNNPAVVALHGKMESSPRFLWLDGNFGRPTEGAWLGASDMATYFTVISGTDYSFPASSDTWTVIAGLQYDASPVTPPVDSGSLTADGGDGDTINGV